MSRRSFVTTIRHLSRSRRSALGLSGSVSFWTAYARRDGLFHGAIIGALTIVVVSIAASAGNAQVTNLLADTLSIIVSDVLLLGLSSLGGWLATRS